MNLPHLATRPTQNMVPRTPRGGDEEWSGREAPLDPPDGTLKVPAESESGSPLVSCIVPVFNGERFVGEALQSALNQTYPNLEIIVVDDGSTDGTAAVISTFGDRVRAVFQENRGPGEARNTGMMMARGEFIAFLDSDDVWRPDKIAQQVAYLKSHPTTDLCFTQLKNFWMPDMKEEEQRLMAQRLCRIAHPFIPSSVLGRRGAFERAGRWHARLRGEDSDYFTRMGRLGMGYHVIDRALVDRRIHGKNLTTDVGIVGQDVLLRRARASLGRLRQSREPREPESESESAFSEAAGRFQEALGGRESVDRYLLVAGVVVRLRFANAALVPHMMPSLEHLGTDGANPARLTIHLWDVASTGVVMPSIAGAGLTEHRGERGFWTRANSESMCHAFFSDCPRALNLLDRVGGQAFYCLETTEGFSLSECASPLRRIFSWWAKDFTLQLVHAAAIGTQEGAVLLAGRGGSGKSTVALTALAGGLQYLSDDYCLVRSLPSQVYSLYSSGKAFVAESGRYPHLESCPIRRDAGAVGGKSVYHLAQAFRKQIPESLPIRAVLVPLQHGGDESRLEPTNRMAALKALAPSTLFQLDGASAADFVQLSDFVSSLPCYTLHLGRDPHRAVRVIADFLGGAGRRGQ